MPDFLPQGQIELGSFAKSFAKQIGLDPSRFHLSPQEAQALNDKVAAYLEALRLATEPGTRTVCTVEAKNLRRAEMLEMLRPVAASIRDNRQIEPADKAALGLRMRSDRPVRTPAPRSAPVIEINGLEVLSHTLRYHDESTFVTAAKPAGVAGLQLMCALGDQPPTDRREGRLIGVITRQPFTVRHTHDAIGKRAWYWGRWQTATGKVGPWSTPTSRLVAA